MRAVGLWLATAVAVAVAVAIVPGVAVVGGSGGVLVLAAVLALVNSFVRPVMRLFALPLTVLTLGLFHFVVNALALELASYLALGLFGSGVVLASFGSALVASLVISLVSSVSEAVLGLR
ncbi:MAG: phage holin family protein [Atopobiaceae bacterium]|nr:phage holin family protein [Olsenella sp.]MDY3901663.1 phage holin family protein [Atopobiaceae bacterium]